VHFLALFHTLNLIREFRLKLKTSKISSKYGSISAAQEKLGTAQNIQKTFIDFQQYLYQEIEA
tara:strand:- start:644 stop:832 length:189 start_codon:yes stop_codon:yes gene_type:complete